VAALAACGGTEVQTSSIPGGADLDDVVVIDEWSRTLRAGDVEGAAAFFAIPSVAQNGPTVQIDDPADAEAFNASLPCGAILVEAVPEGELTVATFELTERPGPGTCGFGAGQTAQTAFRIEDGRIAEWRRVLDEADGGDDENGGGEGGGGGGARPAPSSSA
jgi:hypothetical protein